MVGDETIEGVATVGLIGHGCVFGIDGIVDFVCLSAQAVDVEVALDVLAELQADGGLLCTQCEVVVLIDGDIVSGVLVDLAVAEVEITLFVGACHDVGAVAANHAHGGVAHQLLGLGVLDGTREGEQDRRLLKIVDVVQTTAVASA